MFSAPPTLCFHKSRPGRVPSRMGRCSCTHCHAPCTRVLLHLCLSSSSFRVLPPPVPSFSRRLASARSSFKCFFYVVFFRLLFSSLPFRPTAFLPVPFPTPARAFTFRLPGVITASCGLLAVCRWGLQVVPRGNRSR